MSSNFSLYCRDADLVGTGCGEHTRSAAGAVGEKLTRITSCASFGELQAAFKRGQMTY
jgi:hypothetical protein